jgi:hypothetical protein
MVQDILFVAVYRCPGCDAALEATEAQDTGWVRCPRCGRPSLPSDHIIGRRAPREPILVDGHRTGMSGEDLLLIDEDDAPRRHTWLKGLGILAGIAAPMLIFLAMGRDPYEASVLGVIMAIALVLLLRPKANR